MKKVIFSKNAPQPIGPYSQAIVCNGTIYISGQIALNTDGKIIGQTTKEETMEIMQSIQAILKTAGATFSDVVKTTIFLKNMADFTEVNNVYAKYFDQKPPARECVEVNGLPKGANVEISMTAHIG